MHPRCGKGHGAGWHIVTETAHVERDVDCRGMEYTCDCGEMRLLVPDKVTREMVNVWGPNVGVRADERIVY